MLNSLSGGAVFAGIAIPAALRYNAIIKRLLEILLRESNAV